MSLFTPAVLVILAVAAVLAILAFGIRPGAIKNAVLVTSALVTALAIWLATVDAWAFRDGFPLPSPKLQWVESHGLVAGKQFLLSSWVPLVAAASTVALIVASRLRTAGKRDFYGAGAAVLLLLAAPWFGWLLWPKFDRTLAPAILVGLRVAYVVLGIIIVITLLLRSSGSKSTRAPSSLARRC